MSHGIWSIVTHVIACCVVCDHRSLVNITSDGSFEVIFGDEFFFVFFINQSLLELSHQILCLSLCRVRLYQWVVLAPSLVIKLQNCSETPTLTHVYFNRYKIYI